MKSTPMYSKWSLLGCASSRGAAASTSPARIAFMSLNARASDMPPVPGAPPGAVETRPSKGAGSDRSGTTISPAKAAESAELAQQLVMCTCSSPCPPPLPPPLPEATKGLFATCKKARRCM